ncbi:uncharacterized protein ACN2A1_006416 [Glossina fuscipes fuscipes]
MQPTVDIRELIQLDDAMEEEELRYGPNGGLVFCLEFLIENQEWLKSQLIGADPDNELSTDPNGVDPTDDVPKKALLTLKFYIMQKIYAFSYMSL